MIGGRKIEREWKYRSRRGSSGCGLSCRSSCCGGGSST